MSRAGFDPEALLHYIERVQPPDRRTSPFPARDARLAALRQAIGEIPAANYTTSGEFRTVQDLVRAASAPPRRMQPPPSLN
jgi:hypothetical protein